MNNVRIIDHSKNYKPHEKQLKAHTSDAKVKVIFGAKGSGKTDFGLFEMVIKFFYNQPGSKIIFLRKTVPELRDSILDRFRKKIPMSMYRWYEQKKVALNLHNGSEIWFRCLDDWSKMENIEIAGFWIDQAEEILEWDFIRTLLDRLRQPEAKFYRAVFTAYPPYFEDHWLMDIEKRLGNDEEYWSVYKDNWDVYINKKNLPPHYIPSLELMYKKSPSLFKRYVLGEYAPFQYGDPVYYNFDEAKHTVDGKELRKHIKDNIVYRGWDFGFRNPACVWAFETGNGKIVWDYSFLGEQMGLRDFAEKVNDISMKRYGNKEFIDCCDPAGRAKTDLGISSLDILEGELGFSFRFRVDNRGRSLMTGVELINKYLSEDRILINKENKLAIQALLGGYHINPRSGIPEKDGTYDHICDAFRYLIMNYFDTEETIDIDIEYYNKYNASMEGYEQWVIM